MNTDYSPEAVDARLREASGRSDLRNGRRLDAKIDYGAAAIDRRLRTVASLTRACLQLARARRVAG